MSKCSKGTGKPVAPDNLETTVMPPEVSTTDRYRVQENLLREYEQKFADLRELFSSDRTLLRCRSREDCWKRTVLHDTWWHRTWQTERIMSRIHLASKWSIISSKRMDSWTRRSVQFWMYLSVKDVAELKSRSNLYLVTKLALGSGSWIESTSTWRRCRKRLTLKVLERRVPETLLRRQDHDRHQIQRCLLRLFRILIEKWIDVESGTFDHSCLEVSKLMIRLLRHDDWVNREEDRAVKFEDLASIFRSRITSSSHWSIRKWLRFWQREIGITKRFQYCLDPNSPETFLYLRAIHGHSGTCWSYIARQRVGTRRLRRAHLSRWKLSRLTFYHPVWIDSGWEKLQERHAVFFTAVNPLFVDQHKDVEYDLTNPRIAVYKIIGTYTKIQYIGEIKRLLRRRDCSSIRHDPTQSSFTTLYLRFASRKWYTWSREKNCPTKCINLQDYRKEPYSSRICIMTSGFFQIRSENIRRPSKQRKQRVRWNPWR